MNVLEVSKYCTLYFLFAEQACLWLSCNKPDVASVGLVFGSFREMKECSSTMM